MLELSPISLKCANAFVVEHHRHNGKTQGHKFSVCVKENGIVVGVAIAGRPVSRHLDDGSTIEITRTCTVGTRNANSMLYGAICRAAKALGYKRAITYTQHDESGASLRATGWSIAIELPPRKNWYESSVKNRSQKNDIATGGVARKRWEIHF